MITSSSRHRDSAGQAGEARCAAEEFHVWRSAIVDRIVRETGSDEQQGNFRSEKAKDVSEEVKTAS